jgi:nucleoside-diphosphate-sugar epimerase
MKRVLLTGGTGFIGRHTIPLLNQQGYDIHAITSKDSIEGLSDDLVTWHSVDLLDPQRVEAICEAVSPTHLLHLAWYDDPNDRMTSEKNMQWVEATLQLIREFVANGGKRIVLGGSCTEYDWQYGYCSEDITPMQPQSIYGECKSSLHKMLTKYTGQMEVSFACGRIFFVYGPHESENRLVAYAIRSLLKREQAGLSHGHQMRDYLHVADVADALVTLLESDVVGAVNIGSGRAVKLREIVDLIGEKLNGKDLLDYGPVESKFDSPVVMADTTRLRDELGWTAKFDLKKGIENTISWWKKEIKITTD